MEEVCLREGIWDWAQGLDAEGTKGMCVKSLAIGGKLKEEVICAQVEQHGGTKGNGTVK